MPRAPGDAHRARRRGGARRRVRRVPRAGAGRGVVGQGAGVRGAEDDRRLPHAASTCARPTSTPPARRSARAAPGWARSRCSSWRCGTRSRRTRPTRCPLQVHCGFGDSDLLLPRADPTWLKPAIERYRATPFVLLHCYPFVREAGWLAHVYGNVFFDLSLTIPHVSRPAEMVRQALELAPASQAALRQRRGPHAGALPGGGALVAGRPRGGARGGAPGRRGRAHGTADPARERACGLPARVTKPLQFSIGGVALGPSCGENRHR